MAPETMSDDFPDVVIDTNSRAEYTRGRFLGKTLTEPEVRHLLRQLLLACEYLVEEKVIHRDLKLGNQLLTTGSQLKVADFGLATRVHYPGQLKRSICGTTNYMAPEMLTLKGYSYESDISAVGCIMCKLLVGRPHFSASTKAKTLARIKRNEVEFPPTVFPAARALIRWIVQPEPAMRPSIRAIMHHEFITIGLLPPHLPASHRGTRTAQDSIDRRHASEKNDG
ncbi:serine/threonine-protein kinase PLK1-like [Amblyomma americanum]